MDDILGSCDYNEGLYEEKENHHENTTISDGCCQQNPWVNANFNGAALIKRTFAQPQRIVTNHCGGFNVCPQMLWYSSSGRWSLTSLPWGWAGFSGLRLINGMWKGEMVALQWRKTADTIFTKWPRLTSPVRRHVGIICPLIWLDVKDNSTLWYSCLKCTAPV